jgi:vitamin K-dependent gamma-carboxylase
MRTFSTRSAKTLAEAASVLALQISSGLIRAIDRTTHRLSRFITFLDSPVDAASVCLFRILFGLSIFGFVCMYLYFGEISALYVEPKFFFSFAPFIAPLPAKFMYLFFGVLGGLGILIALGCMYRIACALSCAGLTYILLLEKTGYQNHIYLMCLLSLLFCIIPAHRRFSLAHKLNGAEWPNTIPRWQLFLLRAQIFLVYFYSGIAKLNIDWLQGRPMDQYLARASVMPVVGHWFLHPLAPLLFAYGGLAVDLLLGFLLLGKRTFLFAVLIALFFNLSNSLLFGIDIFPWLMLSTLVLFPDSAWPTAFLSKFKRHDTHKPNLSNDEKFACLNAAGHNVVTDARPKFSWGLVFALSYLIVQILLPLRHFLYPGEVAWTEYGHRFSWRMMLRKKRTTQFQITITDPLTAKTSVIHPRDFLTLTQADLMSKQPDMIWQFARFIADENEKRTGRRPIVHVQCEVSLNGRPSMPLIDQNIDLAREKESIFPVRWILPIDPSKRGPKADDDSVRF